jgi:hypothetical protein
VFEVREVLRLWLGGHGPRAVERLSMVDRKTVRRYVTTAQGLGLTRDGSEDQLSDAFLGAVWRRCVPTAPTAVGRRGESSWRTTTRSRRGWTLG